jgi:hypothetical protein
MNPIDYILIALVIAILGGAAFYIYKAKKSGKKCIGCLDSGSCSSGCSGNCAGCSGGCKMK